MKYGIPVLGTMAHSLVTEAECEYEAFLEQEYDQKYKQYNFDDWIKVDVKSKKPTHRLVVDKTKKVQRRTDIDTEKV